MRDKKIFDLLEEIFRKLNRSSISTLSDDSEPRLELRDALLSQLLSDLLPEPLNATKSKGHTRSSSPRRCGSTAKWSPSSTLSQ